MTDALASQLVLLPDYLSRHMLITIAALAAGVAISVPAGILAVRYRRVQGPMLAAVSILQTVPGLALLAGLFLLTRQLGFLPAWIALTLYSMLPMLRNTVTGLEGIDPSLIEAARGLGMTEGQIIRRVRLPLAAPVIVAGIRTATVWVVGTATLSTPIGWTSLGNYIFSGLQTINYTAVGVGVVAAAGLAIVLDGLIRLAETALRKQHLQLAGLAALGLGVVVMAGLAPLAASGGSGPRVTIGAKNFTEQFIVAELLANRLERHGYTPQIRQGLGSTVIFNALATGEIDVYVDYSGTIWANHMQRDESASAGQVLREMGAWLREQHSITCLGPLGFENAYAFAMQREQAQSLGLSSLEDLAAQAHRLTLGTDYEFLSRPEWESVQTAYGIEFEEMVSLDPALMYESLAGGRVDVITAFSTDGRIAAYNLTLLGDPQNALPPYDAVVLLAESAAKDARLVNALRPLIKAIPDETMRRANKWVDMDGESMQTVAARLDALIP